MNRNESYRRISRGSKDFAGHRSKLGACERPHRFLARPGIERLEPRLLLSAWSGLTLSESGGPVDTAGTMLLLSNGSVMVQGGGTSKNWYELTPDASPGTPMSPPVPYASAVDAERYVNGTFTTLAQSAYQRLYYASDVLPNGDVLVAGGEDALPLNPDGTEPQNKVELYDPIANTWKGEDDFNIPGQTDPFLGDAPSEVLSDGTVLFGEPLTTQTQIFDPSQPSGQQWVVSPSLIKREASSEQGWVKLPDGSIVTTAVGAGGATVVERFFQGTTVSQDQWVEEGPAIDGGGNPIQLWNTGLDETGPGVLLPDGRVFFMGGAGETALYTPSTNTWTDGAEMTDGQGHVLGANDAPAAVLPNGDVLFAAGPNGSYGPPCFLLEYDPGTNQISTVDTTNGPDFFSTFQYQLRMLSLPDGSVLISDQTSQLWIYTPDAPTAAQIQQSAPTVTGVVDHYEGAGYGQFRLYTLSGLRLNGMSEGAYYGDDAQMASNYPIVTLTDASGVVHFARTHDWSSTGMETPNETTIISTEFDSDVPPGAYLLSVSAGGMSSPPYLFVKFSEDDTSPESVTLTTTGGQTVVSGTYSGTFAGVGAPQIAGIFIDGGILGGTGPSGSDSVDLNIPAGYGANGFGFVSVSGSGYHETLALSVALDGETVSFTDGSNFSVDGTPVTCVNVQSLEFDADSGTSTIAGSNATNMIPLTLNILSGAVLALAQTHPADSVMLQVNNLIIAPDNGNPPLGQLDLGNNGIYVNYGSLANDQTTMMTILGWLKSGYNGGPWNGQGIISSAAASVYQANVRTPDSAYPTAIGYADCADGRGIDTQANSIELKYALAGDANLNGAVNTQDLQLLLANFNTSDDVWDTGDFNYDGSTNTIDLQLLLYNFNQNGPQS
jgi:hypothetical protein